MKKWLAPICACLVLGLVAAGCGGDDDGNDSGGSAATTEKTATTEKAGGAAKPAAGKAVEVKIVDIDYDPRDASAPKGATVKWTNTGNLPHTVTKEGGPGPDFDSGTLQPGDTYEQTVDTPGKIAYHCLIHSNQHGSLTVK